MSRPVVIAWLEDLSDWLSPIVVKEVRQIVRGREFFYAFSITLLAAMAVAFFGAADALNANGTSGNWTFVALTSCLGVLGLAIVPIGAFNALRNERMEQTLELITLTALSPRRVVIGKLLAQGVKLTTLFAGMAPFIAMSFLLGGVDFVTILVALLVLFMWSMWACAACLFLSSLVKSRAMSGVVFGGIGIVLFLALNVGRGLYFNLVRAPGVLGVGPGAGAPLSWWALTIMTTFCLVSMANLVLLAENRLSLSTENRVTPLRVGFLVQFLLILAWTLSFLDSPPLDRSRARDVLAVMGCLHLAVVAVFTVTEDLILSRRVLLHLKSPSGWRWLLALFQPGGGRGAAYVLIQMVLLVAALSVFRSERTDMTWLLAACGFICFFTGWPALFSQLLRPAGVKAFHVRVVILLLLSASMVLPDVVYYVLGQPETFDVRYSARHLVNPFRTLMNWNLVEMTEWLWAPLVFGVTGLITYLTLIYKGWRMTVLPEATAPPVHVAAIGDTGSAHVLD